MRRLFADRLVVFTGAIVLVFSLVFAAVRTIQ